jgi:arabinose-5-phosphate isomerase
VLAEQASAVARLADRLDESFCKAVEIILQCQGHLVVSGMGKSGLVGRKMASTFASTGTPSFFLHPSEAQHGDLGQLTARDVALLISYSGETDEVLRLIPYCEQNGIPTIAITGRLDSTLAHRASATLDGSVQRESCPLNLAPTTSAMAALALGDALAVALMRERDFRPVDFARFHPGGSLGRTLLTQVRDAMRTKDLPFVSPRQTVGEAILMMAQGRMGLVIVQGDSGELIGIVTDGDLRRGLSGRPNLLQVPVEEIMTRTPVTIEEGATMGEAEERMQQLRLKALLVTDAERRVRGVVEIFNEHQEF